MKAFLIGLGAAIAAIAVLTFLWVPGADLWGALVGIAVGIAASRIKRTA